jgi:3-hydroxyacyl-CoA dehydrogenase/enoyl-CoA hydratase/3-hydroxybutyryl-CoA epimerase
MSNTAHHWQRHDDPQGITWLTLDQAGSRSNTLSRAVLEELAGLLEGLHAAPPRGVVIASGKSTGFIAGADIREFEQLTDAETAYALVRQGQQVMERLATLPCPSVAMIAGHALGGGLELALACRYRVCVESEAGMLGLPEVQLGIHPGFGGTVRSVALIGLPAAMDMMLTGRSLRPARARTLGLVDRVVPADKLRQAAREMIQRRAPARRAPAHLRALALPGVRHVLAARLRRQVAERARPEHYPAPYAIVDLWARHGALGPQAYEAEARSIARLFLTPTCRNLVRVFFLQERMKSLAGKEAAEMRRLHVIGAGVMGGDIAAWAVLRGFEVSLQDRDAAAIARAQQRAVSQFERRLKQADRIAEAKARLVADEHGEGVAEADVIIEAIVENLEAKQQLFQALESRARKDAVLASNTSSIRLEDIAAPLHRPQRLVGLHFFNPVARLPLVEVIRSESTDATAFAQALAFTRQIGKLPLPCASQPGFLVNRILSPYMGEAITLHREGIPLAMIDETAEAFGMPMGPIELADSVGLDVAWSVATILGKAFDRPLPEELHAKVAAGEFGRKTGRGFYRYEDGKPIRTRPPTGGSEAPEDIEDRLILPMINEAVACFADGVVDDLELLDAGVIFGTGFAPFRGGPVQYARSRGLTQTRDRLASLAARYGERFTPHPGWDRLIAEQQA